MSEIPRQIKEQAEKEEAMQAEELAKLAAEEAQSQETVEEAAPATKPTEAATTVESKPTEVTPSQTPQDDSQAYKELVARLESEKGQLAHKIATLQGMLSRKDDDRDTAIRELREQVKSLAERKPEPQKPSEKAYLKYLSAEERKALEESGTEPLEIRGARGEIDAVKEQLIKETEARIEARLKALRDEAEAANAAQKVDSEWSQFKASVFAKVEELVPGFQKENLDPNSKWNTDFLNASDADSLKGGKYLDRAVGLLQMGNAKGIAQLWKEYIALNPSGSRAEALASQVKPAQGGAAGKPSGTDKTIYTKSMYDRFLRDQRMGKIAPNEDGSPRTPKQIAELEAAFEKAMEDGTMLMR